MAEQSPYALLKAAEDSAAAKLWEHGTRVLSTTELIALVIGDVRGVDAQVKAREMLTRAGGENALAACDAATLQSGYGLGRRQAERVAAAFELGRRAQIKRFDPNTRIRQPKDIADRYIPALRDLGHEEFWVVHLNRANVIVRHVVISKGGMSASVVDPHEVFREAILDRAASVILLHNHPSGNPEPSREDIALTRALVDAGRVLQLPVSDHVIIAGSQYTSLKERGLM